MQARPEDKLLWKLNECPLFSGSLGPSLRQRISTPNWFENRFIQAILRDTGWIEKHERLLVEADIGKVKNSDKIFGDLDGGDLDYDLKIFDVLAEVRLIRWARDNGYTTYYNPKVNSSSQISFCFIFTPVGRPQPLFSWLPT